MKAIAALLLLSATAASVRASWPVDAPAAPPALAALIDLPTLFPAESLAAAGEIAERQNPFHPSRRPGPSVVPTATAASTAVPRVTPQLLLQGIVGGPPWSAVVQGVPGREAPALLQPGDTAGGLRVVSVSQSSVVISSRDTTWVLRLVEAIK